MKHVGPIRLILTTAAAASSIACSLAASPSDAAVATVSGVQAHVDALLKNPVSIGISAPLPKKPPSGKTVIVIQAPEPVSVETDDGFRAAGKVLGWQVKTIQEGSSPESAAIAFGQAIADKPDAIDITGTPLATLRGQVARAKAAGIPVVSSDAGDPVGQDGSIHTLSLNNSAQLQTWGHDVADYVSTQRAKDVLIVDLPVYSVLHAFSEKVAEQIKSDSPGTGTTVITAQLSDLLAGHIPGMVVSAIERNPRIDWVIFPLGDMTTGLNAALKTASLSNVRIGGANPNVSNITELMSGENGVWAGFPAMIHGWWRIDALARILTGGSLTPNDDAKLPTQLLTPNNVKAAVIGSDGYYVGVHSYEQQFEKLWLLK